MQRFASLFGRFLQEEGPSVEWDRIQKLPAEAVKDYATLSAAKDTNTVSTRWNIKPESILIFFFLSLRQDSRTPQ